MTATIIDHSPAVIDHTGLTAGLPWLLSWAFGPEDAPEDLTGKTVKLILKGTPYTLTVDLPTATATFSATAEQTAAFTWAQAGYLLLIGSTLEVKGTLTIGQRVKP